MTANIFQLLKKFTHDDRGSDLVEKGVYLAAIVVVVLVILDAVGVQVTSVWQGILNAMG